MVAVLLVFFQVVLLMTIMAIAAVAGHWNAWGLFIWVASLVVFASAFVSLGDSLTPSPIPNQNGLKTGGIYRLIRHPMYLSLLVFGLGSLCFSAWSAIPLTLLAGLLIVKIDLEERLLSQTYSDYAAYQSKTKKLVPYVW